MFFIGLSFLYKDLLGLFLEKIICNFTTSKHILLTSIDFNKEPYVAFLSKMILFFPLTWLAIFLSKRISETTKIKQTYLHKEVVSKSYVNHLNFITKHYSPENEEIKQSLTSVAISALGFNPALLLEKSTSEKIPMEELLLKIIDNAKLNNSSIKTDKE
ncbi:hypothetical protein E4T80_04200 [Muribacter muris]|uniref:Uncharacterized protein n=1 Tax=Muribacter muris TaxID=67855 RepID=A0A4Y9K1S1_9PAST|nr:hypothetical protein [Muribacter muris]MBF0784680.1 hypothetical protein [Muribacter muris]MBF0828118.1 hypothetical protein [Muribacter muris]TFV11953.1 hypothetical protein E4T80_04200 [Muribacter muris]